MGSVVGRHTYEKEKKPNPVVNWARIIPSSSPQSCNHSDSATPVSYLKCVIKTNFLIVGPTKWLVQDEDVRFTV